MDKDAIILEVRKNSSLMGKDNVVAAYLFGSVADGTSGSFSDIDICIIDDGISWNEKLEIAGEFGNDYDVSFFSDLPIWIRIRVLRGVAVFVNDKKRFYDISFGTLREYEDFRPLIQKRIFERFGRCMI